MAMATSTLVAPASVSATGDPSIEPLELPAFTGSQALNDYIVSLTDDALSLSSITDQIALAGGTVTAEFEQFNSFSATLTSDQASALAAHPSITNVELDRYIDIDGPDSIPNRYIITVRRGTNPTTRAALVSALADNVVATYRHALDGYAVELNASELKAIKDLPGIATIEQDQVITLDQITDDITTNGVQTGAPWGLDRLDQVSLPLDNTYVDRHDGDGVTAYIIDTGITPHVDFGDRLVAGQNFYTDDQSSTNTDDCNGHGTHVAGTVGGSVHGVAKNVTLVPVRVFGCSGSTSTSTIVSAIDWVIADHDAGVPAVSNMSLGGGASASTDLATRNMVADGIISAVAAGNSNQNACYSSPAREPLAITVAASTSSDARASFSNFGSCVDVFAPGQSILSTWIGGSSPSTATNTISGTSMASPHVAGAAAVLWGLDPTADANAVTSTLLSSYTPDKISNPGTDSPNRLLYLVPGDGTPPGAPTDPVAVNVDGTVTVSWTAPVDTGTGEVSSYTVTPLNSSNQASTPTCTWTSGPLQCSIGGLRAGTWTFIVRAANPWGSSDPSAASNSITIDTTNDDWAGARALSGLTGTLTDSNSGATTEPGEPTQEFGYGQATKWFKYTPTSTGSLTIDTHGSRFDTVLGVYTGSAVNALTLVEKNDDSSNNGTWTLQSRVNFTATASTTYWIRVNSYSNTTGTIILNWDLEATCTPGSVSNDQFCTALGLSGATDSHTVDTTTATVQPNEPGSGTKSVWYTYSPDTDGTLEIARPTTPGATWLEVYTGSAVDSLTAHPDWTVLNGTSPVSGTLTVDDKTTYIIRHATDSSGSLTTSITFTANPVISEPSAPTGLALSETSDDVPALDVSWLAPLSDGGSPLLSYEVTTSPAGDSCSVGPETTSCTLTGLDLWKQYTVSVVAVNAVGRGPAVSGTIVVGNANDMFANANVLTGDIGTTYSSNEFASAESGEPAHPFGPYHSMWFNWTAPANGELTVTTVGSNYDTTLAAYTGTQVDSLLQILANDDAGGALTSAISIDVTSGITYRIAVDGYGGRTGAITLNWDLVRAAPPTAPTGVRAVATGPDRVIVAWSNPTGSLPITGATVTANPGGATCTTASTTSCAITGLTTGSTYTFTVVVANELGNSPVSAPSAPVTLSADTDGGHISFPSSWGQDRIDETDLPMDGLYSTANRGDGVIIFVVDTGITNHAEFGDRLLPGYDGVGDEYGSTDCHGHGTHVASTSAGSDHGVADDALLVAVRVLDCGGGASTMGVLAGLNWVASYNLAGQRGVVNMSLGGVASESLDDAVADLVNRGIVVAVAAGNEAQAACNVSPAREPSAITVGATDSNDYRAWFSNFGDCVDIFAPGVDIIGAALGSGTDTMSGTSMASPHVAGAAALVLSAYPTLTPAGVADVLTGDATRDRVVGAGTGSPNLLLMVAGESLPINPEPIDPDPHAPKQVIGTPGDTTATISWTPGDLAGNDIARFTVTGTPSGACTAPAVDQTSTHSCVVNGLTNGTAYTFTVVAIDTAGRESQASNPVTVTPVGVATPPEAEPVIAAIVPERMLDTRQISATGTPTPKVGGSNILELPVLGRSGVPTEGVAAVAMNVTVTETETGPDGGFLTVFPCGGTVPNVSNLNFTSGQTVANSVIAPVSNAGTVCFYVAGQAHVLADISGAIMEGAGFRAVDPSRRLDTRTGHGDVAIGRVENSILEVPMLGRAGVPDSDVTAVSINLTVTDTLTDEYGGFATVFPCDAEIPNASNLNFLAGQTVPNSVISPLSADGRLCVFVQGMAHVIIDVNGAFDSGVGYESIVPSRLTDTRFALPVGTRSGFPSEIEVQVTGIGGVPYTDVTAASLNVTVVAAETDGYATVYPCGTLPESSNVNFVAGQTVANAVLAPLSEQGTICVYVEGSTNVIVDVNGYITTE
jgi:subtilisin family serine protease